jgi:hypothetical protein
MLTVAGQRRTFSSHRLRLSIVLDILLSLDLPGIKAPKLFRTYPKIGLPLFLDRSLFNCFVYFTPANPMRQSYFEIKEMIIESTTMTPMAPITTCWARSERC